MENYGLNNKKRVFRYTIIGVVVVVLLLVSYLVVKDNKFHVVSTNPNTNNVSIISPFFKINFNKMVSKKFRFLSSTGLVSSYGVSGKTIYFNLNVPLVINQSYEITISDVTDSSGAIINKTLDFTAQDITFNNLPTDQQQSILNKQVQYQKTTSNPILNYLPYGGLDYSLSASQSIQNNKPVVTLNAKLLLSVADTNSGPVVEQNAINQAKQNVINYIRSLNLNPNNYTINYEVVPPAS